MDASAEEQPGEVEPTRAPEPVDAGNTPPNDGTPSEAEAAPIPEAEAAPSEPDPADELRSQVDALTTERDDALRRLAELETSESEAKAQVVERDQAVATLTGERDAAAEAARKAAARFDAVEKAWGDEQVAKAIREHLERYEFNSDRPGVRDKMCRQFVKSVLPDLKATLDDDMKWSIRPADAAAGRGLTKVYQVMQRHMMDHSYLFKDYPSTGSGSFGGNVPPGCQLPPPPPGSLEAIAARMNRNR